MKIPFVDLHAQYLTIKDEIDAAIADVIKHSAFVRGPHVEAFEVGFRELIGTQHCISCANGTDAIYVTLKALGVGAGDEVITTAHSWIATSETITQAGARVAFVDTEEDYFCLDPAKIEAAITPRTKGIVVVHLYGQPADMDAIMAVAEKHGLWVIEDCAQAHLATYKGRKVGTMGIAGTFSFYPGKNLGSMGDAGCIVTNDDKINDFACLFARHGGKGNHLMEGINSRMDGIQAAVLNVKLKRIADWTLARRAAADRYDAMFAGVPGLITPVRRVDTEHVFHLYVIQVDDRGGLRTHLNAAGIGNVINYPRALPHYQAYDYLGSSPEDFPIAGGHSGRILSIPLFPEITEEQQRYVADNVIGFLSE
jgi:dTDP-4-amino-4,6-dideoxygalactose transaminase